MSTHFGRAGEHLQLASIELECAGADFAVLRASTTCPAERADLDAILSRLTVAKLTLQLATVEMAGRARAHEFPR